MTVLGFALLCTAFMNAQRPKGIRITNVQCTAFRGRTVSLLVQCQEEGIQRLICEEVRPSQQVKGEKFSEKVFRPNDP